MSIFNIFRKKIPTPKPWAKFYTDEELRINIPNMSMYDQVKICCDKFPERIAIEYFDNKIRYKDLIKKVDRTAIAFKRLGLKKGDIVTICMPNTPEVLISLYALNKLGVIANMLHPLSAEEEIKDSLNSTNSKAMIMYDGLYDKVANVIDSTNLKRIIKVSVSISMPLITKTAYNATQIIKKRPHRINMKFKSWRRFILESYLTPGKIDAKCGKNTPAVILHSGGTSGKPKNVVLQNRSFVLMTEQAPIMLKKLMPGDASLAIMPNFHGFGLAVTMHCQLVRGIKVILVPQFDAKKFDTLLNKTKPAFVVGVPTLFEALVNSNNEKKLDLSCVKYIVSGGDKLPKTLEDKVNEYFEKHNSNAKITQGYGLSEALAAVCLGHDEVNKSGSVGVPIAGNYVKIIDPATRKTLPYGEVGEIVVHNNALMMGYLNDESETNDALQMHEDGYVWLHTGDLGHMDEEGFVFYEGRQKRMIITSGYNVYPSHVEEVIESHPAVLQCTVVGVPHPYKQEVGKAFIVLKEGYHGLFIKSEIKEYCKKNLAKYAVPHDFVYRKNLPKTKLGKVDFQKLKEDNGADDDE